MSAALAAALLAAAAAGTPADPLATLLAGRVADAPVRCILPEHRVPPVIVDQRAIVFRRNATLYVARPAGACPALTQGAQLQTSGIDGQLCQGEAFRLARPPGGAPGACFFGSFTPYRKVRPILYDRARRDQGR